MPASSRSRFDLATLVVGMLFVLTACAFQVHAWQSLGALLPAAPGTFAAAVDALASREQMILFPLGVLTTIVTIIALFQQGVGSTRGRLRVLALLALMASAVVTTTAIEPLHRAIAAAVHPVGSDQLALLARRWNMWQWINLGLALTVGVALVTAHRLPAPAPDAESGGLTRHHRTLLLLLGAATLFEGYDRFIVSLALPYIGKDLGAAEGQLGYALSLIRVGALLSIGLGYMADRIGRRRVLLITVVAYTLATAATGLSRGIATFVLFQLVATIFLTAELALAQVVITEEFPAESRGRGQGMLGAFAALGAGIAALLFPMMQHSPLGWRGLYFVGILPLLLVAYLRRSLPETRRWQQVESSAGRRSGVLDVLRSELRQRFVILNLVAFSATFVAAPTFSFASYHATNDYGWTPAQVSAMILTGGGLGLSGWFIFGRLADRWGRRLVGVLTTLLGGAAVIAFYRSQWLLPAFATVVFAEAGISISINSLGTELFPTQLRATAKAWITNAGIVGAVLGLALVGALSRILGGVDPVIAVMAFVPMTLAPLLFFLPETCGEELEEIETLG